MLGVVPPFGATHPEEPLQQDRFRGSFVNQGTTKEPRNCQSEASLAGGGADLGDHPEQLLQRRDGGAKSVTGPAAPELLRQQFFEQVARRA